MTTDEEWVVCTHKHKNGESAFAWGSENPVNAPCMKCGTAVSVELARAEQAIADVERLTGRVDQLTEECEGLEEERDTLVGDVESHVVNERRLEVKCAQAEAQRDDAEAKLARFEAAHAALEEATKHTNVLTVGVAAWSAAFLSEARSQASLDVQPDEKGECPASKDLVQ